MDFTYEKLSYQEDAITAVVDTLSEHNDTLIVDNLDLNNIDKSVRMTLKKNNFQYPGEDYLYPFPQFNIEMETGTGKTMVYLRTIMEIHKKFGENKFIIVVPNRAIKAGVEENLKNLKSYLSTIHNVEPYNYFTYSSKKIHKLQSFEDTSFVVMVTTVQAFNKDKNIIRKSQDNFFEEKPINTIQQSEPVVIIDEPQSVDRREVGKEAIKLLNPKFVLRYSATHIEKNYPLLYRFGPVEAYEGGFVKSIETLGTEVNTDGNLPSIELKKIETKNNKLEAKVTVYKLKSNEYVKGNLTLKLNDSLEKKSKNSRYENLGILTEINSKENFIKFENQYEVNMEKEDEENEIWLAAQFRSLVKDHLDRELELQSRGIKVLSLVFLDRVENYRQYENKTPLNGKYAQMFESIYTEIINSKEEYKKLDDYHVPVEEVHDGYFSEDKNMLKNTTGDTLADESTYKTIMTDKDALLTKYNPNKNEKNIKASKLRFIFSHSALKEGWDNPNVFQILTISNSKKEWTRRQKIGRGLRISVNQEGERVYGNHNIVTVYANESFEDFALGLQHEYIEAGVISNKIDGNFFKGLLIEKSIDTDISNNVESYEETEIDDTEQKEMISESVSNEIVSTLKNMGIIEKNGQLSSKQRRDIQKPEIRSRIIEEIKSNNISAERAETAVDYMKVKFTTPIPSNRKKRKKIRFSSGGIDNALFIELWNKISPKLFYKVMFDEDKLIEQITEGENAFHEMNISKMNTLQRRARISLMNNSITGELLGEETNHFVWDKLPINDLTKQIADNVHLTRATVIEIIKKATLKDPNFINKIKQNPSLFTRLAIKKIKVHQRKLLTNSLVYFKSEEKWSKEDLRPFELYEDNIWEVPSNAQLKTLFKYIQTDSSVEITFANSLAYEKKIKYFMKLPNWFKIPTPFGNYNPDWAILAQNNNELRLYFVVDTKSQNEIGELRSKESDMLKAGRQAYKEFSDVAFIAPVTKISDLEI